MQSGDNMTGTATLDQYDCKRFAVSLPVANELRVFSGKARYSVDADLGPILRIEIEAPGDSGFAIIVEQSRWEGAITPDANFGCDFFLAPALSSKAIS
jgi:hypothetical protein